MLTRRWSLALPLVLAASITSAHASTIRDSAGLFSPGAVREAQSRLDTLEKEYRVPITIESIDSLDGRPIDAVLPERAKQRGARGLYVLIAKRETKIEVERTQDYAKYLTNSRLQEIKSAFVQEFKKRDFDAGLKKGLQAIERVLAEAKAEAGGAIRPATTPPARGGVVRGQPAPPAAAAPRGTFGLSSLLGIGLLVLAVLLGVRLLGSLFGGGNRGYAGQGRMGGPGPGYGAGAPGYGGAGGGGGGGFMSSMFGGIGGALAGNWLYDQFSGRQHGGTPVDSSSMGAGAEGGQAISGGDAGAADWGGGDGGADWGGDAGGGADVGGGGDWGGGGGDWGGGGGGDWGGGGDGGGGGDW